MVETRDMPAQSNGIDPMNHLPGSSKEAKSSFVSPLRALGDIRDGILVLASLTYGLGYITWALYASRYRLGLIPALDAQYFLAGLTPLAGLLAFLALAQLLFRLSELRKRPISPGRAKWGSRFLVVGVAALAFGFLATWRRLPLHGAESPILILGAVLLYGGAFFQRGLGDRFLQNFGLGLAWVYLVVGGVALPTVYFGRGFESLPQEWGGAKTRNVVLDLAQAQLSSQMRSLIIRESEAGTGEVVRTRPVQLVFEGNEFLYFSLDRPALGSVTGVIRLRRSLVVAMLPADSGSAGRHDVESERRIGASRFPLLPASPVPTLSQLSHGHHTRESRP